MDSNQEESLPECGSDFNKLADNIQKILEREPNPYLAWDIEDFLLNIWEGQKEEAPEHFPTQFTRLFKFLRRQVEGVQKQQQQELIKVVKNKIQSIQAQEITLWDSACQLLKFKCIKSLQYQTRSSIMKMLNSYEISPEEFIQYVTQQILCEGLSLELFKQQMLQHRIDQDCADFLARIVDSRSYQLKANANECLLRYQRRIENIETWLLTIRSQDYSFQTIQGIIVKASCENDVVVLVLQEQHREIQLIIHLSGGYIGAVEIIEAQDQEHSSEPLKCSFENSQESNRIVSLAKASKGDREKILEFTKARRALLIKRLLEGSFKKEYQLLLSKLINNQLNKEDYSGLKIQMEALQLVKMEQAVGKKTNPQAEIINILKKANFLSFVKVESELFSQETVEMLQQANDQAALLQDKQIISFYGKTGAGKSTSINHYSGLMLAKNEIIQNTSVYDVSEYDRGHADGDSRASIGHSFVLSDTLYSKGFSFIEERYSPNLGLKDILLCDNPGFMDTRGEVYEIVTSYSIDRAVRACGSIKAIVLVMEFSSLTSSRSTGLFESIQNLKQLYPHLLDLNSQVFENFYILFTKAESQANPRVLSQILNRNKKDFQIELKNNRHSSISLKLKACEALVKMCQASRIVFVNLDEDLKKRQDFLKKVIGRKGSIDKKQFASPINNKKLDELVQKVSEWTLSCEEFVFTPFLRTIPETITCIHNNYTALQAISRRTQEQLSVSSQMKLAKSNLLQEIQERRIPIICKEIQLAQSESMRYKVDSEQELVSDQVSFFCESLNGREQQLTKQLTQFSDFRRRKAEDREIIEKYIEVVNNLLGALHSKKLSYETKMMLFASQPQAFTLYNKRFVIGQKYKLKSVEYLEDMSMMHYLKHLFVSSNQIVVGQKKQILNSNFRLKLYENQVKFDEHPEFDPSRLLQKRSKPDHKAYLIKIQSNAVTLRNLQFYKYKNFCLFEVLYNFPENPTSQQQLPRLVIQKIIPGEQFNRKSIQILTQKIINYKEDIQNYGKKRSELLECDKELERDIRQTDNYLRDLEQKLAATKSLKEQFDPKLKGSFQEGSIQKLLQIKRNNLQQIKSIAESLKQELGDITCSIQRLTLQEAKSKQKQEELLNELTVENNRHKRLAFLIRDQERKGTFEILQNLVRIVIELTQNNIKRSRIDRESKAQQRMHKLSQFLKFYSHSHVAIEETMEYLLE